MRRGDFTWMKKCSVDTKKECDVRQRAIQVEHDLNDMRRQDATGLNV